MTIKKIIGAVALMGFMASANAASVTMVYTGGNDLDDDGAIISQMGDMLTFQLDIDFSDIGGIGTLGGGFDVNWDVAGLALGEYVSAGLGDPFFGRDPVQEDGRLFNGAVGNFNGLTTGTIANITFVVTGGEGDYLLNASDTLGDSGNWTDENVNSIFPDYNDVTVRVVPVPAAVWFMLSGLGALIGFGRRKAA